MLGFGSLAMLSPHEVCYVVASKHVRVFICFLYDVFLFGYVSS